MRTRVRSTAEFDLRVYADGTALMIAVCAGPWELLKLAVTDAYSLRDLLREAQQAVAAAEREDLASRPLHEQCLHHVKELAEQVRAMPDTSAGWTAEQAKFTKIVEASQELRSMKERLLKEVSTPGVTHAIHQIEAELQDLHRTAAKVCGLAAPGSEQAKATGEQLETAVTVPRKAKRTRGHAKVWHPVRKSKPK